MNPASGTEKRIGCGSPLRPAGGESLASRDAIPKDSYEECGQQTKKGENAHICQPKDFGRRFVLWLGVVRDKTCTELFGGPGTGGGCDATDGEP